MIKSIELLKDKIDDLSKIKFFFSKNKILNDIEIVIDKLKNDTDLIQQHQKQALVAQLLMAKSDNQGLKEFKNILNNEFMDFANQELSLSNEAEAILKLQAIEKELEMIVSYPDLYTKNTIAIGGGFSSGKSEFISSFLNSDLKLPIGIEPTTAIPTYVVNNEKRILVGCTHKGGAVNLANIDENFQSKLSHKFIQSFGFNIKDIMPFMVLGSAMAYEHICFIDTPGYNPSDIDGRHTNQDIITSKTFLENTSVLIWLIGIDSNGTIPASDLKFLSDLDLKNKKLYIVLNKADLKGKTDIENILSEIEENLNDYAIDFIGLSAFSSINKKEYFYKKTALNDFLNSCNIPSKTHESLVTKVYDVYAMYKRAISEEIDKKLKINRTLNSIMLDFLEDNYENQAINIKLNEVKKYFDSSNEERDLKLADNIFERFKNSIDVIFNHELKINIKQTIDNDIKKSFIQNNFQTPLNQKKSMNDEIKKSTNQKKIMTDDLRKKLTDKKKKYKRKSDSDMIFWIGFFIVLFGVGYLAYSYLEYSVPIIAIIVFWYSGKNAKNSFWKYSSWFVMLYFVIKLISEISK